MKNIEILRELNDIMINYRDPNSEDYKNACKERFKRLSEDNINVRHNLEKMEYYMQIDQTIKSNSLIEALKGGGINITPYGRTIIDLNHTSGYLYQEIETKKDELERLKDNLIVQALTLMGIFVAIISFIYQGIKLISIPEFIEKTFFEQISTSFALYLPVLLIPIALIFLYFLLQIVKTSLQWLSNKRKF